MLFLLPNRVKLAIKKLQLSSKIVRCTIFISFVSLNLYKKISPKIFQFQEIVKVVFSERLVQIYAMKFSH